MKIQVFKKEDHKNAYLDEFLFEDDDSINLAGSVCHALNDVGGDWIDGVFDGKKDYLVLFGRRAVFVLNFFLRFGHFVCRFLRLSIVDQTVLQL